MTLDWLHLVLLAIALAAGAYALLARRSASPDVARMEAEREQLRESAAGLVKERDELRARAAEAEKREAAAAAKLAERDASFAREREQTAKLQAEGEARFRALASEALLKSQERFVALADETLKKHKEGAAGELKALMKPIEENFTQFRDKVAEIEKVRAEDRAKLDQQIKEVGLSVQQTGLVAARLATALTTGAKTSGRWGEETLRNVLEMAGLSPFADFSEQTSTTTEKGRLRPDVIVRMPGGRELVIDSKVSLQDYLAAIEETDPAARRQKMAAHAARVRAHVQQLANKEYAREFADRVDFVAMFIPGENFYAAVLEHDREIFDFAARNNVVIVTPSTLIALAKAVAYGWRQEQMARNAEQAARLGQDLHDRLLTMCEHIGRVGGGLGNAMKAYNDMVGSLEARVLPAARKFEELSLTKGETQIEAPKQLDIAPRQLTLLEPTPEAAAASDKPARKAKL